MSSRIALTASCALAVLLSVAYLRQLHESIVNVHVRKLEAMREHVRDLQAQRSPELQRAVSHSPAPSTLRPAGALPSLLRHLGPIVLLGTLTICAHVLRYVGFALAVQSAISWLPPLRRRKLQQRDASEAQRAREFWSSIGSGAVFGAIVYLLVIAASSGATRIYGEWGSRGALYEPASLLAALVIHDSYFYWTHRWMHSVRRLRFMHAHHHRSRTPTVWAAFAFHPLESFVNGAIYLVIPLVLPIHPSMLGAFVLISTLHSVLIHSGHDVFCVQGAAGARWHGTVLATSIDHDLHHAGRRGNFALYFSWWDRVGGTRVTPL